MSCYVVDKKTINVIVYMLAESKLNEQYSNPHWPDLRYIDDFLRTLSFKAISNPASVGKTLLTMNEDACKAKYSDYNIDDEYTYKPVYVAPTRENKVRCYKSLRCYLYQCAEGKIPDTALYHGLRKYACSLASMIIESLPEWDRAEWS